jgi:hypothetical protein
MSRSIAHAAVAVEDNRVESGDRGTFNKVDRLPERAVSMAKAAVGAAVKNAIGDAPMKQYGDKGQLSNVISGEGVPDYMARIYEDPAARRRYAISLLKGDPKVRMWRKVEIEIDDEEIA